MLKRKNDDVDEMVAKRTMPSSREHLYDMLTLEQREELKADVALDDVRRIVGHDASPAQMLAALLIVGKGRQRMTELYREMLGPRANMYDVAFDIGSEVARMTGLEYARGFVIELSERDTRCIAERMGHEFSLVYNGPPVDNISPDALLHWVELFAQCPTEWGPAWKLQDRMTELGVDPEQLASAVARQLRDERLGVSYEEVYERVYAAVGRGVHMPVDIYDPEETFEARTREDDMLEHIVARATDPRGLARHLQRQYLTYGACRERSLHMLSVLEFVNSVIVDGHTPAPPAFTAHPNTARFDIFSVATLVLTKATYRPFLMHKRPAEAACAYAPGDSVEPFAEFSERWNMVGNATDRQYARLASYISSRALSTLTILGVSRILDPAAIVHISPGKPNPVVPPRIADVSVLNLTNAYTAADAIERAGEVRCVWSAEDVPRALPNLVHCASLSLDISCGRWGTSFAKLDTISGALSVEMGETPAFPRLHAIQGKTTVPHAGLGGGLEALRRAGDIEIQEYDTVHCTGEVQLESLERCSILHIALDIHADENVVVGLAPALAQASSLRFSDALELPRLTGGALQSLPGSTPVHVDFANGDVWMGVLDALKTL